MNHTVRLQPAQILLPKPGRIRSMACRQKGQEFHPATSISWFFQSMALLKFHVHDVQDFHGSPFAFGTQDELNPSMTQQIVLDRDCVVLILFEVIGESAPFPDKVAALQGNRGGSISRIIKRSAVVLKWQRRLSPRRATFFSFRETSADGGFLFANLLADVGVPIFL